MSLMKCPFCAEEIQEGALICKHCKSKLNIIKNDKKLKKKNTPLSVLLKILGVLVISSFISVAIINITESNKNDKKQDDINSKIKVTEEYITGINPIRDMLVYNTDTFGEFVNPTGLDSGYSDSDFPYNQYILYKGDQVSVYEESTERGKTLVKSNKDNNVIIGWIDSKALVTKEEYDILKKKEEEKAIKEKAEQEAAQKAWENSKAGKICKKHSNWDSYDCNQLADNQIWIGMSLDMLKVERGNPNSSNPSNYGSGTHWQWCWDDYTPMCFYGGSDGIITSYN